MAKTPKEPTSADASAGQEPSAATTTPGGSTKAPKTVATDPHAITTTFPDPGAIFSFQIKPLADVEKSAVFVLDTNALLVPYRTGRSSLDAIKKTYTGLVGQKQLVVPAQVAREFARQRAEHLKNTYKQLSDRHNVSIKTDPYPLFEGMTQYEALRKAEMELASKITDYKKAVSGLLDAVRAWQWNDPVSSLYSQVFTPAVVVDIPNDDRAGVASELEYRYANRIPPGFKDDGKPDGGIGDFLIWKTILHVGKTQSNDVVFVSGEEKTDWWHRSDSTPLYPRFELVDEFRRISSGKCFYIIGFDKLLELRGVDTTVVDEVRREQDVITAGVIQGSPVLRDFLEPAVFRWLSERYRNVRKHAFPHFEITAADGSVIDVYVYPVGRRELMVPKVHTALRNAQEHERPNAIIVLGTRSRDVVRTAVAEIADYMASRPDAAATTTVVIGRLDARSFKRVETVGRPLPP